jgi:hypothetical protein
MWVMPRVKKKGVFRQKVNKNQYAIVCDAMKDMNINTQTKKLRLNSKIIVTATHFVGERAWRRDEERSASFDLASRNTWFFRKQLCNVSDQTTNFLSSPFHTAVTPRACWLNSERPSATLPSAKCSVPLVRGGAPTRTRSHFSGASSLAAWWQPG